MAHVPTLDYIRAWLTRIVLKSFHFKAIKSSHESNQLSLLKLELSYR